jgi:hypothetical protein
MVPVSRTRNGHTATLESKSNEDAQLNIAELSSGMSMNFDLFSICLKLAGDLVLRVSPALQGTRGHAIEVDGRLYQSNFLDGAAITASEWPEIKLQENSMIRYKATRDEEDASESSIVHCITVTLYRTGPCRPFVASGLSSVRVRLHALRRAIDLGEDPELVRTLAEQLAQFLTERLLDHSRDEHELFEEMDCFMVRCSSNHQASRFGGTRFWQRDDLLVHAPFDDRDMPDSTIANILCDRVKSRWRVQVVYSYHSRWIDGRYYFDDSDEDDMDDEDAPNSGTRSVRSRILSPAETPELSVRAGTAAAPIATVSTERLRHRRDDMNRLEADYETLAGRAANLLEGLDALAARQQPLELRLREANDNQLRLNAENTELSDKVDLYERQLTALRASSEADKRSLEASKQREAETAKALLDSVESELKPLPIYTRYCKVRRERLDPSGATFMYLSQQFTTRVVAHRPAQWAAHCQPPILEVAHIEKLHNPRLQNSYMAELENVAGLCGQRVQPIPSRFKDKGNAIPLQLRSIAGLDLNEYHLYHGVPSDLVQRLTLQGLDERYAGEHFGKLFGDGVYLASNSSKSDIYTCPNAEGLRCILLVRACLGEAHISVQAMQRDRHAPERPDGRGPLNSVVAATHEHGGVVEHPEFIMYSGRQTLPEYAIWYRHGSGCLCTHCAGRR